MKYTCAHINCLYENRCTEDPNDKKLSWSMAGSGVDGVQPVMWLIRLTQLGRETFYPMWTAEILLK